MPTYDFKDRKTGKVRKEFLWMHEFDAFVEANPHLEHIGVYSPPIGDPMRLGVKKTDKGFQEVLGKMKKFYKNNTIES